MTTPNLQSPVESPAKPSEIDLRDPWLAAFLSWLIPGLGHIYQRRWGKGGLFMACILGTFFYGLWIGGGRVVYASFREPDFRDWRWHYIAQVASGLPALPAVVQAIRTGGPSPKAPLFGSFMAPPMHRGQPVPREWVEEQSAREVKADPQPREYEYALRYFREFRTEENPTEYYVHYDPDPHDAVSPNATEQSGQWNYKYGAYFDLGTVFTMIAGLLNVLAVWDAWGGPMVIMPKPKREKNKKKNDGKEPADASESDETVKSKATSERMAEV
ncbi:MAG: hypothetical protein IT427_05690 [Pirellulales bacterium]|nr:hypothetical protein [Pirellulales bacterium]